MKLICVVVFFVRMTLVGPNLPLFAQQRFPCLPPHLRATDIVSAERVGDPPEIRKVTVEERLVQLCARCEKDKLFDGKGKEIRFYRLHCFGAPTAFALETMRRERDELAALKKEYTVIEMTCSPSGAPTP